MLRVAWVNAMAGGLLATVLAAAQDNGLDRAIAEAVRLRGFPPAEAERDTKAALHTALRDWVESLLPQSQATLTAGLPGLQAKIGSGIFRAGLLPSGQDQGDWRSGFVAGVKFSHPAEAPEMLFVTVGASVECGEYDVVYGYDYSTGTPRRALEARGSGNHDESVAEVLVSRPDESGSRVILTLRYAAQCGSSWNTLSYDVFRLSVGASTAQPILADRHDIWFGASEPYRVRLEPDEILMEIRDRSIDAGIHNRAHVLHYRLSPSVERIDPVALLPQDFVDEWLTRPWAEMESRSAGEGGSLKKWHEFLGGGLVAGDISLAQSCGERAGDWQIGVDLEFIHDKEIPEPLRAYFIVHQSEQYRFQMMGISFGRQEGCPGQSGPSQESPSLFQAKPQQ